MATTGQCTQARSLFTDRRWALSAGVPLSYGETRGGGGHAYQPAARREHQRVGQLQGANLLVRTGELDISGSGSAVVNVTEELDVGISGSGSVEYLGTPVVSSRVSGSGSVSQR